MMKAGTPEKVDLEPGRDRPVPAHRLPEGRGDPLQGQSRLLGRQGRDRQSRVRHHARCLGALAEAQGGRVPGHGLPEPGRHAGDEAGPCGQPARAARASTSAISAYNTKKKPFDDVTRAQGAQHGGQQAGDHRRRVPGRRYRRPRTRSRRRSGPTTTPSRTTPTIPRRPRSCSPRRVSPARRPALGHAGRAALQSRTPSAWRS